MKYIENLELREWVKENLRKAIFHKVHALATQTGCEILLKIQDDLSSDISATRNCFYATDKLASIYTNRGIRKQRDEVAISGDTGLPIVSMVDRGIQSKEIGLQSEPVIEPDVDDVRSIENDDDDENSVKESSTITDIDDQNDTPTANQTGADSDDDMAVPMQLSLTCTTESSDPTSDRLSAASEPTEQDNIKQEHVVKDDDDVRIKVEVIDDDDEDDMGDLQMMNEQVDEMGEGTTSAAEQSYHDDTPAQTSYSMSPKPYQCGMCQKAFRSIQVLQKHTQTFHQRSQQVITARSKGRGFGVSGGGVTKQRHQFQVPSSAGEQRFPCVLCNRNFRHPALLEDHMNRSHMSHPSLLQSNSTAQSQKSVLETQLILQDPSIDLATSADDTDPSLPKITSVESLQQIIPQSSPGPRTTASTSSAPFTQGSPMAPVFRFQSPVPSTSAGPSSSQSRTQGASPNREYHRVSPVLPTSRGRVYNTEMMLPTSRDIMSAILLSASAINSYRAFKRLGPRHLRDITKQQYTNSARELEESGMGLTVISQSGGVSYIKRAPVEVGETLEKLYSDLCSYTAYSDRFYLAKPKAVQLNSTLMMKLRELNLAEYVM